MFRFSILIIFFFIGCNKDPEAKKTVDILMIGAGIMSSTLGSLIDNLDKNINVAIIERMNEAGLESSEAWNNAGTGHAGYCELNYTPELLDGSIDIKKAVEINKAFLLSKEYWKWQVKEKLIPNEKTFLKKIPHISFVFGEENVTFLKKRFFALVNNPLFYGMEYTEDKKTISSWVPLIMEGRKEEKVSATRFKDGLDVNFGTLTKSQIEEVKKNPRFFIQFNQEVVNLKRNQDKTWLVIIKDLKEKNTYAINAKAVFIGAGGASLTLLQKANIKESKGLAGFPVGGMWLVSNKNEVIKHHEAKVYGRASLGAPPMSVPHLDSRYIDGKEFVLFGPFATFSTKFLKTGSIFDLFMSINFSNIIPMVEVAFKNFDLIKYLVKQVLESNEERMNSLREYYPLAKDEDWQLEMAGQRVQVIKSTPDKGSILQFGTELISSHDGTLTALLGASPGASVAVKTMLDVLNKSFSEKMSSKEWRDKLKVMIPSYQK